MSLMYLQVLIMIFIGIFRNNFFNNGWNKEWMLLRHKKWKVFWQTNSNVIDQETKQRKHEALVAK